MNDYKENLSRREERQQRDNETNNWKDKRMKELFHGMIDSLEDAQLPQIRQIKIVKRHEQWTLHNEDKRKKDDIDKERKENKKRQQRRKESDKEENGRNKRDGKARMKR